jgi:hypothetical protein
LRAFLPGVFVSIPFQVFCERSSSGILWAFLPGVVWGILPRVLWACFLRHLWAFLTLRGFPLGILWPFLSPWFVSVSPWGFVSVQTLNTFQLLKS